MNWRKSSHSRELEYCVELSFNKSTKSSPSGNCVEIAFTKSTKSGPYSDMCVEVGTCNCTDVHMRDSKDQTGPVLTFERDVFAGFIGDVKSGKFDL